MAKNIRMKISSMVLRSRWGSPLRGQGMLLRGQGMLGRDKGCSAEPLLCQPLRPPLLAPLRMQR